MTERVGGVAALAALVILSACVRPTPTVSPISPVATARAEVKLEPRVFLPLVAFDYDPELAARPISSKKGLAPACGYSDMARFERELRSMRIAWLWNWSTSPPVLAGIESVPAIWGRDQMGAAPGGNSRWLMGFNEPDLAGQANLTPSQAADLWATLEGTYPDRLLASPQPSHIAGGWLADWYAAYVSIYERKPRVDALAFHCYAGVDECIALTEYYAGLARAWGVRELWVTEFAFGMGFVEPAQSVSVGQRLDDLTRFVEYLELNPVVTRYAYYTNRGECCAGSSVCGYDPMLDAYLFHWTGQLSVFGKLYRTLP